jgi:hypothetical protein
MRPGGIPPGWWSRPRFRSSLHQCNVQRSPDRAWPWHPVPNAKTWRLTSCLDGESFYAYNVYVYIYICIHIYNIIIYIYMYIQLYTNICIHPHLACSSSHFPPCQNYAPVAWSLACFVMQAAVIYNSKGTSMGKPVHLCSIKNGGLMEK